MSGEVTDSLIQHMYINLLIVGSTYTWVLITAYNVFMLFVEKLLNFKWNTIEFDRRIKAARKGN